MQVTTATFQDRYDDMKDSLTRRAVSPTDTCVVLDDYCGHTHADMRVMHISSCGWIDLFHYVLNDGEMTQRDHVSIQPAHVERMIAAYADWQAKQ